MKKLIIILVLLFTTSCSQEFVSGVTSTAKAVAWNVAKKKLQMESPLVYEAMQLMGETDGFFIAHIHSDKDGHECDTICLINKVTMEVVSEMILK